MEINELNMKVDLVFITKVINEVFNHFAAKMPVEDRLNILAKIYEKINREEGDIK